MRLLSALALPFIAVTSCMPPSVKAVDDFLGGYGAGDSERVIAAAWPKDREILRPALEEAKTNSNGPKAILLPPRPVEYEIVEIEKKESEERHVVLVDVTMKNPLPFAGERVGQSLEVPRTRSEQRRFLSVREGERWYVKLDLPAVEARARFAEQILHLIAERRLDVAESMLGAAPPPPDDPNAQKKSDRLVEDLRKEIVKGMARSSTTATSSTAISPEPGRDERKKSNVERILEQVRERPPQADSQE